MKKLLILAIGLAMPIFSFSQLSNFDLSSYKLPDITINKLDFTFDLSGEQSALDDQINSNPNNRSKKNVWAQTEFNYYRFRNKSNYQGSLSVDYVLSGSLEWLINREDTMDLKKSYNSDLDVNSQNKFYFIKDWFIGVDINFHTRATNWYGQPSRYAFFSIPVQVGKGRIEPVEDSRLAIYILEDLQKKSLLLRLPDNQEVLQIAAKISKLRKKRFFDHRIRGIYELQSMDSLLKGMELIGESDIQYFTVLSDNWGYSSGPQRWSGKQISAGINTWNPNIHDWKSEEGKYELGLLEYYFNELIFSPMVQVRWEVPVNLHWQKSFSLSSVYHLTSLPEIKYAINNSTKPWLSNWENDINYSYYYYPNSRTTIGLTCGGQVNIVNNPDEDGIHWLTELRLAPKLELNANYYFSPQLRLNFKYRLNYGYDRNSAYYYHDDSPRTRSNFFHNVRATLLYSIF